MWIEKERKQIKLFHRTFKNVIKVINTQYFNDIVVDVAESYYMPNGKMVLHYWHNYNYILHETKGFIKSPEKVLPKLELKWRSHPQFVQLFEQREALHYEAAVKCFEDHPELADLIHDYIFNIMQFKPINVLDFTVRYFQKFRNISTSCGSRFYCGGNDADNTAEENLSCFLNRATGNKSKSCKVDKKKKILDITYYRDSK